MSARDRNREGARTRDSARCRLETALLVVLLLLLAARGSETALPEETPDPPRLETAVAKVVGDANPLLSPRERERIGAALVRYSAKYDLDADLVLAMMIHESTARPWVRSPKGALGLMQVMPYMASPLPMAGNHTTLESNIEAGCLILARNIARLGEEDGVSAYFWGSNIRDVSYLNRIRVARAEVRRHLHEAMN